jgi:cephalosporin-C deacetylase-like acetyl esterase
MKHTLFVPLCASLLIAANLPVSAQEYGSPDRSQPGDEMIQAYLATEAMRIHEQFGHDVQTSQNWLEARNRWLDEYYYMLGLERPVRRTPLHAHVTGQLNGDGFVVEMLHFQSRPGLYVTGNLYRPAGPDDLRRPAVLYVCGHSSRGRDGNKTAYQSHGIWFARHGYVCLMIDTLQLGEIAAVHHGTYNKQRWWWHSRGYTPAGVECLNGIRAIDYLTERDDVDPARIAVTGISGGGAATFWIAAADERVNVAVPVSGMADLPSYVNNRVINGHCDCMFLYNTFQWPWTRIAGLVAPRALLFVNSDNDSIFPMDANERVINRLERVYRLYGAGDMVDSVVSVGGHAYREDIRKAAFRFINLQLNSNPSPVGDSEVDLVDGSGESPQHPIDPARLRVFPAETDLPQDELNTTIDEVFVPTAQVAIPSTAEFRHWKESLQQELRRVALRPLPQRIPAASVAEPGGDNWTWLNTETGIRVRLFAVLGDAPGEKTKRIVLVVANSENEAAVASNAPNPQWFERFGETGDRLYILEPRGVGATRWTLTDPPNYVARAHVLLGRTVDLGRIWDVVATARYLSEIDTSTPLVLAGHGSGAVLAAYAGLLENGIDQLVLDHPSLTHMQVTAPHLLNVLRVCDIPHVVGMFAPRQLAIQLDANSSDNNVRDFAQTIQAIYAAAGATQQLSL